MARYLKVLLFPIPFVAILVALGLLIYRVDGSSIDWVVLTLACIAQYVFSAVLVYKTFAS